MKELNTQDFIDSYKVLDRLKYPNLDYPTAHVTLAAILTVSIEWDRSFDEIQQVIDRYTLENKKEYAKLIIAGGKNG